MTSKFWSAIQKTSFWNFFVKFGHKGPRSYFGHFWNMSLYDNSWRVEVYVALTLDQESVYRCSLGCSTWPILDFWIHVAVKRDVNRGSLVSSNRELGGPVTVLWQVLGCANHVSVDFNLGRCMVPLPPVVLVLDCFSSRCPMQGHTTLKSINRMGYPTLDESASPSPRNTMN